MSLTAAKASESAIMEGLMNGNRQERSAAIRQLCTPNWVGLARRAVQSVGGKEADVEDVFQESLAALVKNVMQGKFKGDSKMSTYFFQICKWRYLKAYQQKELPMSDAVEMKESSLSLENSLIARERKEEFSRIINQLLGRLGNPCSGILKYRKLGYSYQDIAEEMDYDNPDTVKNQASRCRKKMRDLIESTPGLYSKLKSLR